MPPAGGSDGQTGGSNGAKAQHTVQMWLPLLIVAAVGVGMVALKRQQGGKDGRLRRSGGISYAPAAHAQDADARTHSFGDDAFNSGLGGEDDAAGIALMEPPSPSPPSLRHGGGGGNGGVGGHGGIGGGGSSGRRPASRPGVTFGSGCGYHGRGSSRPHEAQPLQAATAEEDEAAASAAALRALRARPKESGGAWDEDDEPWL